MTVRKFKQPDFTADSAAQYKANIDNSIAANGEVTQHFAPSEMAVLGMGVTIGAGINALGGSVAAQNLAGIGAPGANPRIDRIYYDMNAGTVVRVVGAEAAVPAAPVAPFGTFLICDLHMYVGQTQITNNDITDVRSFVMPTSAFANGGYTHVVDPNGADRIIIGKAGVDNRAIVRLQQNDGSSKLSVQQSDGTEKAFITDKGIIAGGSFTVATLPAAGAGYQNARTFVTDASATLTAGIGTVVAGGGANKVPVICDGTNWRIG